MVFIFLAYFTLYNGHFSFKLRFLNKLFLGGISALLQFVFIHYLICNVYSLPKVSIELPNDPIKRVSLTSPFYR